MMLAFALSLHSLFIISTLSAEDVKLSLDGNDWKITDPNYMISAKVPGSIYIDLLNANKIKDPFYGNNPNTEIWVANKSWTYTKQFNVSSQILNKNVVQLISQGLDTKADIYLNDKIIFKNDNMFHRNYIEIKSMLKEGLNNITIIFYSKVKWALEEAASCNTTTDGLCPYDCHHGFCDFNFIRTQPSSAGWDWAASYGSMGIWKSIYLQAYDTAVIRDWIISAFPVTSGKYNGKWNMTFTIYIDAGQTNVLYPQQTDMFHAKATEIKGNVNINIPEMNINKSMSVSMTQYEEINITLSLLSIDNPKLWMPNGYNINGKPFMYNVKINFVNTNGNMDEGIEGKIGLREIELEQPIAPGGYGTLFYFKINGITIPIHGSNWIPSDAFQSPQRINKTSMEYKFIGLNDSYQNMIRNWGGGIYQHDFFYDLCDEYGILIWHDMMFASDAYWVNAKFLKSVKKEVFDQVRRIQYHASIAIWSGNNEDEPRCKQNPEAYSKLTFGTVLDNIAILDDTRARMVSSPSNGNETESDPCDPDGGHNVWFGDFHAYLYDKDCWNTSIYVRSRFQSEFGLQSFPSYTTMTEYIPSDQRYYNSTLMQNRNKHPNGMQQMIDGIKFHYNLPTDYNSNNSFEYMLYLTQVYQAYCIKIEVEFYRSIRNNCSNTLPGCNMGQMYWQTDDFWPGASWSAIDWRNRYKMLQYYASIFNQPLSIIGFVNYVNHSDQEIDNYQFWSVMDESAVMMNMGCNSCKLQIESYSWINGSIATYPVNIGKIQTAQATFLFEWSKSEMLTNTKCDALNDCVIKWSLYGDDGSVISKNWMFLQSPKKTIAKDPKLNITNIIKQDANKFEIWLNVENMAAFVWIETSILGYFNNNGMLMAPGLYKDIIFFARSNTTTVNELKSDLYVYSLYEAGGFKH